MALPGNRLDRWVTMTIGGVDTDVTQYVYQRDSFNITRGRSGEGQLTQFSRLACTLDNRDRRFSPRNQTGPYFRKIGRNTPVQAGVRYGERFLPFPGTSLAYASAPDSAGTSITGDLDVRVDITLRGWRNAVGVPLVAKWTSAGNQRSWFFQLEPSTGRPQLFYSADGATFLLATSRIQLPWPPGGRCTLRVTLDVNDGAGNNVVTFYYSTTAGTAGPWRQLGDPVVTAGTTSLFDSTSATFAGGFGSGAGFTSGRLHGAEIRNGIGGTVVASPTFAALAEGVSSFSDGSNTWTLVGATATNKRVLFTGEIPAFPLQREQSGKDLWVPIEAAGIMRRLAQGSPNLQSTLRKAAPSTTGIVAYWPMEDGEWASVSVSGLSGGLPMRFGAPAPAFGQSTGVFDGAAALPTLNGSAPRGGVQPYTSTGQVCVRMLLALPAGGSPDGTVILRILTGGTAPQWDLVYGASGTLALQWFDSDGVLISGTSSVAFQMDGRPVMVQVNLTQNGANVDYAFATVDPNKNSGGFFSGTATGRTVTVARAVQLNPSGALTDTVVGHVIVSKTVTSVFALGPSLTGYASETAGRRVERLCTEQGIPFVPWGDLDDTVQMGPQPVTTLLEALRECEAADSGILFEPRDVLGLAYRPGSSISSPGTRVVLDGGAGAGGDLIDLAFQDDDQLTRNDVSVTRRNGTTARAQDTTSILSVSPPPAGVGRYDTGVTLNVYADSQVDDEARWLLNLGTVDEPRYPGIEVSLARDIMVADTATTTACLDAELGDGVDITSPPTGYGTTRIRELIAGTVMVLDFSDLRVRFIAQPARPWDVGVFDYEHPDEPSRYDTDGTTVNGAHSAGATSIAVTVVGRGWGFADGAYDIRCVETGEEMRVNAAPTGTAPSQTLPVTRGVNGTSAVALTGGETIELARYVVWGMP